MSNIIDSIQLSGSSYDVRDKSATTVVEITQSDYDNLPSSAKTSNILYIITDGSVDYITSGQCQTQINNSISGKQDTLISGTNIKTINNESILGSGNIDIQGGGKAVTAGTNISITTGETADTINCTIPFEDLSNNLLLGYNLTLGGGTYYSLGISPKDSSTSIQTKISGNNAIAIGNNVTITGGTGSRGEYSVAIGKNSNVYGVQSTALGIGCNASGNTTLAIGRYSTSKGNDSVAIGNQANVSGNSSVAIGRLANVSGDSSVAIGSGATANGVDYKTNINNQLTIDTSNQVYIYNKDNTEMICLQDQLGGSSITIDSSLDSGSTNPVANSAITTAINDRATKNQAVGSYQFGATSNVECINFKKVNTAQSLSSIYYPKINGKAILTSNYNWAKNNYDFQLLETSAITTSITSSSTDAQVPSAKAVNDKLGGLSIVKLTQAQYDALATKDNSTLYVIVN